MLIARTVAARISDAIFDEDEPQTYIVSRFCQFADNPFDRDVVAFLQRRSIVF